MAAANSRGPYVFAAVVVLALLAWNTFTGGREERLGNPAVHARIESLTDCTALQREFDTAYANHQRESAAGIERLEYAKICTSYMNTADKRMRELGCYNK